LEPPAEAEPELTRREPAARVRGKPRPR